MLANLLMMACTQRPPHHPNGACAVVEVILRVPGEIERCADALKVLGADVRPTRRDLGHGWQSCVAFYGGEKTSPVAQRVVLIGSKECQLAADDGDKPHLNLTSR